jgi:putative ABC transport system permease protein
MRAIRNLRVAAFLAARSFARGNAGVTALTVAMMAVVFISVLFLPSLIRGAITTIHRQLIDTTTSNLIVTPTDPGRGINDLQTYVDKIRKADGVAAATPTQRVGTQITHGTESNTWGVDAIDPHSYAEVFTTARNLVEGKYLDPADTEGIFLGIDVAGADNTRLRAYSSSLKTVHVGDTVKVTLSSGKARTFVVRGIYQNSFPLSDQGAYITTAAADQLMPRLRNTANRVYVKADPGISSAQVQASIDTVRRDVQYQSPDQLAAAIQDQIDTFDLINNIMRVISLLVAAITVFIITYVDLTNRRRQIGIERAIGIRSGAIVGSYLLKSIVNATLGTMLGLAAFRLAIMPYVDQHPFQFPNGAVTLVSDPDTTGQNIWILLAVSVVSALIPALRTVTMKILDAIWGT